MKWIFALCLLLATSALAQAPQKVRFNSKLFKSDGTPESGTLVVKFTIFDQQTNGTALWTETQSVSFVLGVMETNLGELTAFPTNLFNGTERFLEVEVGNPPVVLTPRMKLVSVPYAISSGTAATATTATTAQNVNGGTVNASSISVGGTQVIDSTGNLTGNAAYLGANGVSVTGRTIGLVPGCQAGETLRWSGAPTNAWQCAAGAPAASDGGAVAYAADPDGGLQLTGSNFTSFSLLRSCSANQVLKWSGDAWVCADDNSASYNIAAGQGLALTGAQSNLFGLQACANGQILKFAGGVWACQSDTDTLYTAAVNKGLVLVGNGFGIDACPSGQVLKSAGAGNWACAVDDNAAYDVIVNGGLRRSGNNFGIGSCASGEIMKSQGSGLWSCQSDNNSLGTVTQILTTGGISGGPITSTGTLSLAGTVPNWTTAGSAQCPAGQALRSIANDGTPTCVSLTGGGTVTSVATGAGLTGGPITGAGTISVATGGVTNAMLANSSVTVSAGAGLSGGGAVALGGSTSLSLTSPVSAANGGTGITGPTAAGQFLRSSAPGAWSVATLVAGDIPSLSSTYVDLSSNQTIGGTKTFSSIIQGSISGNAATATNGVVTTGTYADPIWITSLAGSKITGSIGGNAAGFTGNLAGDVTGPQGTTVVARIRGTNVSSTAPTSNQVLAYNGITLQYEPTLPGGDLSGGLSNATVTRIRGRSVSNTAPSNNQVLSYNSGSSQWEPASRLSGCTWAVDSTTANNQAREATCPASTSAVSGGCIGDGVATLLHSYARPEPANGSAITATTSWLCSWSVASTNHKAMALCCP